MGYNYVNWREKMESRLSKFLKYLFRFMCITMIGIFTWIQCSESDPFTFANYKVVHVTEGATLTLEDGISMPIDTKGQNFSYPRARAYEVYTLEMMLPVIEENDLFMALFSNKQEMWIYVDEVLREHYNDEAYRIMGNYTASNYILVPLTVQDSGKELKVEYHSVVNSHAGIFGVPMIGTKADLVIAIMCQNRAQIISAILLAAVGVIFIIFGIGIKYGQRSDKGLCELGIFSILISIWIFCQSRMRAFYFSHMNSADVMILITQMLIPAPLLMYFNSLMKCYYQKYYTIAISVVLFNFVGSMILELTGILTLVEILISTHIIILLTGAFCFVTVIRYARKEKMSAASSVIIGVIGFVITTIWEDLNIFFFNKFAVGDYIGFGIMFFLIMLGYAALRGMVVQEQEYQDALRANSIKSVFLANMSHEIRTPINTIMGMGEMILRENKDKQIENYAVNIQKAGKTLLTIINDILDFTKMESGKMDIIPRRYDLGALLNDVINAVTVKVEEKNLSLAYEVEENLPSILYGDEVRIKQAITNVLTNAVKYTKYGKITLTVRAIRLSLEEIRIYIIVADTGIGIKPEEQQRMFDSFVRLDENRNKSIEGTGLGMAITKQIVDMMQGEISVESEYGQGSTFTISFVQKVLDDTPIGGVENWRRTSIRRFHNNYTRYQAKGVRLLVVDDNEMNLEVIKGFLKETGAQIETAESGMDCLELFEKNAYDLIFLDHMMPQMDGVETLKRLQTLMAKRALKVPVVALTANAISGAREEYLRHGFADYIAKPVEYKALVEVLERFVPGKFEKCEVQKTRQDESVEFLEKNGIHMKSAIKYAGDDIEQYLRLLQMFSSDKAYEKRKNIYEAYRKQIWNDYLVYVHGLKNSARTIGADYLADIAFEHEKNSKEGNIIYITEHYEELMYEWSKSIEIVKEYLQKQQEEGEQHNGEYLKEEQIQEIIEQIKKNLEGFKKKEAMKLMKELVSSNLEEEKKVQIEKAVIALEGYEYELALQYMNEI